MIATLSRADAAFSPHVRLLVGAHAPYFRQRVQNMNTVDKRFRRQRTDAERRHPPVLAAVAVEVTGWDSRRTQGYPDFRAVFEGLANSTEFQFSI
jgi:hypothetical protein